MMQNETNVTLIDSEPKRWNKVLTPIPSKSTTALLTNRCTDHFYGTFPPLLVQLLFLFCFDVCVVDACLDLPPASILQSLCHFVCLLLPISEAVLDRRWG